VHTAQVDNILSRNASVAVVEEGIHAMHGEVRYEQEGFIGPFFFPLLLEHVA